MNERVLITYNLKIGRLLAITWTARRPNDLRPLLRPYIRHDKSCLRAVYRKSTHRLVRRTPILEQRHTLKIFRGRKTDTGCIVELDNEGYTTQLSLEKSLQVVDHSPDGFQWGYTGSGPPQLAAAILNEVTEGKHLKDIERLDRCDESLARFGATPVVAASRSKIASTVD